MSKENLTVKLKDYVDEDTFKKLQEQFGGRQIYIPKKGSQNEMERRNELIKDKFKELKDTGKSREDCVRELCIYFNLSRSRIEHII